MIKIMAAIVILAAQTASAEQRANKPFTTVNGRTVTSPSAGTAPKVFKVTSPGGGISSNSPAAPHEAAAPAPMAAIGGGHAAGGSGRRAAIGKSAQRGVGTSKKAAAAEEIPPYMYTPGALIRTTGHRLPEYEKTGDARTHTVDAGEIVLNPKKAYNVAQAPSIQPGARDTPPPPNPGTGTRTTTGGAAANSPVPGSGGGDNNGNGNNGKGKPGDTPDPHPTLDDAVNSAY